jgi:hypothetical protein
MLLPRFTASRLRSKNLSGVPFAGSATGVGHEIQPLSDVRCPDARSAQIGTPAGISHSFQVSTNSGEPFPAIL